MGKPSLNGSREGNVDRGCVISSTHSCCLFKIYCRKHFI